MKFIVKIIISSFAFFVADWLLKDVVIDNYPTTLLVALVLSLLNFFVRPILIVLTIPITIFTLGVFLFFVNAIMIMITASLIDGFTIMGDSFLYRFFVAFIMSIIVSIITTLLNYTGKKSVKVNKNNDTIDVEYEEYNEN